MIYGNVSRSNIYDNIIQCVCVCLCVAHMQKSCLMTSNFQYDYKIFKFPYKHICSHSCACHEFDCCPWSMYAHVCVCVVCGVWHVARARQASTYTTFCYYCAARGYNCFAVGSRQFITSIFLNNNPNLHTTIRLSTLSHLIYVRLR